MWGALEICSRYMRSWVRGTSFPGDKHVGNCEGCYLQQCYGCPSFFARDSSWILGVIVNIYIYILESQCIQHLNTAYEEYDLVLGIHLPYTDFNCIIRKYCNSLPRNTQALSASAEPDVWEFSQMQFMNIALWMSLVPLESCKSPTC